MQTASPVRIKKLAIHPNPHLEEIFAIWLLRTFRSDLYPGAPEATIEFWSAGSGTPDGRPVGAHEAEGTLVLGTALSRLDDHLSRQRSPGTITCSAQLVAEALGVADDPTLESMLGYISEIDSKGGAQPFDLWNITKLVQDPQNGVMPKDPRALLYWCFRAFKAVRAQRQRFLGPARQQWVENAQVWTVPYKRCTLRIGEIHADDREMNKVGRWHGRCDVLIIHGSRSDGHGNSQVYVGQHIRLPARLTDDISRRYHNPDLQALRQIDAVLNRVNSRGPDTIAKCEGHTVTLRQVAAAMRDGLRLPPRFWVTAELGRMFRCAELANTEPKADRTNPSLWSDGTIKLVPQFYVHAAAGWVFNGSNSAPNIPQSTIRTRAPNPGEPSPWVKLVAKALIPQWAEREVQLTKAGPTPGTRPEPVTDSATPDEEVMEA